MAMEGALKDEAGDPLGLGSTTQGTVIDEVLKQVVGLILEREMKPGDRLPAERELMQLLGVGRSSLREAIRVLITIGVVEVTSGAGMFVGRGDPSVLTKPLTWALLMGKGTTQEIIEARYRVEVELASMAAERATDEEIAELGRRLEAMRKGIDDPDEFTRCDLAFHEAIARAAHNRIMYEVFGTLRHLVREWIWKTHVTREEKVDGYNEHLPILEAIRSRDVRAARAAMMNDMRIAGQLLEGVLSRLSRPTDQQCPGPPPEDGCRSGT